MSKHIWLYMVFVIAGLPQGTAQLVYTLDINAEIYNLDVNKFIYNCPFILAYQINIGMPAISIS